MDSHELIDAQFDRAVEIVQSLPKNGPIQTGYEEKLTMYSLYKQATVGNVQSPRPSVWDMLGRAKWDAWAKHKDLDQYEAKWLYVDALLKVLRRYSDKTVAMDLVRELESYTGDPSNIVMSGSLSHSRTSSSSGSTISEGHATPLSQIPPHLRNPPFPADHHLSLSTSDDESSSGDEHDAVPPVASVYAPSQLARPQSSMSSRRYRTPMAGSLALSPSPAVPEQQPLPAHTMESAFAEPAASASSSSAYPRSSSSFGERAPRAATTDVAYAHPPPSYRAPSAQQQQRRPYGGFPYMTPRPPSRPALERAVEHIQAGLAAVSERIEVLELQRSSASLSSQGRGSPRRIGIGGAPDAPLEWDIEDMGMWSVVLRPLVRVYAMAKYVAAFVAHSQGRSPAAVVLRRLLLDISFLLCVLAAMKVAWRRSGMRRREVLAALKGVWWALAGRSPPRKLVDRAV